jgi:hypothetical protein
LQGNFSISPLIGIIKQYFGKKRGLIWVEDKNRELCSSLFVRLFADITVGAVNGITSGISVPIGTLFDGIPLCFRTAKVDIGQLITALDDPIANLGNAGRNRERGEVFARIK